MKQAGLLFLLVSVTSCSFQTFPPQSQLVVALRGVAAKAQGNSPRGGRGPQLSAMQCFGLFVEGETNPVTASQLSGRSPYCLGTVGTFHGPYTFTEVTSGIPLTLSKGSYKFRIVGFHDIACGPTIAPYFPFSNAASAYRIGESQTIDTAITQKSTITSTYSDVSTANQTPLCSTGFAGCSGFGLCDTFSASDGALLGMHALDIGTGGWNYLVGTDPQIFGTTVRLDPNPSPPGVVGVFNPGLSHNGRVVADVTLSATGTFSRVMVLGRVVDDTRYVYASVERNYTTQECYLELGERVGSVDSVRANLILDYISDCDLNIPVELSLQMVDSQLQAEFNGRPIYFSLGANYAATAVGFGAKRDNVTNGYNQLDNFRFLQIAGRGFFAVPDLLLRTPDFNVRAKRGSGGS